MLCIFYVIAVGTLLGMAGLLVERALPASGGRRWVWCVVIPMSLLVVRYSRLHHTASMTDAFAATPLGGLDAGWWARIQSYDPTINRLWLVTSTVLLLWGVMNALWTSYVVHMSRSGRSGRAVVDGIPVVVTDSLGPATVGVLRSRVLLPRWVLALPGPQRRYVVRHEEEHRRAHDARLLFFASLLLILTPWNLALWWQLRRLSLATEMDCDHRVVRALGDAQVYGDLLLKIAEAANRRGPHLQPALLGGVGMLEHRLTVLLAPTPLRRAWRLLLPAAIGALLFIVLSMPHPVISTSHAHSATPSHTEDKR